MATPLTANIPYATPVATASAVGRHRGVASVLLSARVRILGWFVVLIGLAIAASLVIQRQVLIERMLHRVDTQLSVDASALDRQAQPGSRSVSELFDAYLKSHVAGPHEELLTIIDGRPYERSVGGDYPIERVSPLIASAGRVTEPTRGDWATPAGDVRYLAVPVLQPGSPPATFLAADFVSADTREINGDIAVAAAVSLSTLLLMSVLAWLVAGRVLSPVRLMTDTARTISESDLTRRIPNQGDDEIGRLAATFNAMLDRLQSAFVSQREFVNDAGHELRTPITVVRGHLELLGDDPTEREETLALVSDELDRMSRMVDDLLVLARAERPGFLRLEPVAVGDLVHELLAKVTALAPRRWSCRTEGTVVTMADRQRLTQAVMNLVSNSVAHTRNDDVITVSLIARGDEYRLVVSDTGTGIAVEDQARVFERFARGRAERRRSQGAGLGLAIVKVIAEAHHGRVEVRSAPGEGATFSLVLPVQPPTKESM